ncbi:hydroxypyruvate reductase [Arthrobacter sp. JUb119]|uniref:DUF4147 domain-containing protein n=1 Tax=Arthrobacter sp. JUb115 TaxID=2485108 RepID=UPI001061B984|nr:DUF4147 domain-containing protein [Arthrobacter sp. JUb115]MCS3494383.1 hydroxypyruvate reductase [Arthrobacter sp. JUb119]TDU22477.1 glycerate 2-kinase [Arthrobacter sp. JUb115]
MIDSILEQIHTVLKLVSSEKLHMDFFEKEGSQILAEYERIFAICIGKSSQKSAMGIALSIGSELREGVIVDDQTELMPFPFSSKFSHFLGNHPIPDGASELAAKALSAKIADWNLSGNDLVIVSISGGTSSLICSPVAPIEMSELQNAVRQLLGSGITVTEINSIRRLVGTLHNGRLRRLMEPASVITLLQSDNAQFDLSAVGSGPTIAVNEVPSANALDILLKSQPKFHSKVSKIIDGKWTGDKFRGSHRIIELSNLDTLLQACVKVFSSHGFEVIPVDAPIGGSCHEISDSFYSSIEQNPRRGRFIYFVCGEATVSVPQGSYDLGGRCQHMAVTLSEKIMPIADATVVCFATDGCDNISGIHGAAISSLMARNMAAEFNVRQVLDVSETHPMLDSIGALITGDKTGVNLCDIYLVVC